MRFVPTLPGDPGARARRREGSVCDRGCRSPAWRFRGDAGATPAQIAPAGRGSCGSPGATAVAQRHVTRELDGVEPRQVTRRKHRQRGPRMLEGVVYGAMLSAPLIDEPRLERVRKTEIGAVTLRKARLAHEVRQLTNLPGVTERGVHLPRDRHVILSGLSWPHPMPHQTRQ